MLKSRDTADTVSRNIPASSGHHRPLYVQSHRDDCRVLHRLALTMLASARQLRPSVP